jgi:hypothetical protein
VGYDAVILVEIFRSSVATYCLFIHIKKQFIIILGLLDILYVSDLEQLNSPSMNTEM